MSSSRDKGLNKPKFAPQILLKPLSIKVKVKVKLSHYRPGQAPRVPGGWSSQISRHSAHEVSKVVSPTHRAAFTPQEMLLVVISVRGWVDPRAVVQPEGLCQWGIPLTPIGSRTGGAPNNLRLWLFVKWCRLNGTVCRKLRRQESTYWWPWINVLSLRVDVFNL